MQRVRAEIDASGITYIYYQFVSVTGRIMGKGVPADHWESMARKGFQLVYGATANLFVDRHGNYIGYGPEAPSSSAIARARDVPGAALGPQGRARVLHLLPRPRGREATRLLPDVRLPRQPQADP